MTEELNKKLWNEYFYENTEILINNFDCKDFKKLKKLETTI